MELEEDPEKKKEPWKDSVSYPSEDILRRSFAEPGSFAEQQLKLDEIDDLVNDREYGRAKCLLDEMIPNHYINEAEHSFQLARCYIGLYNKEAKFSHLKKAKTKIEEALRLNPTVKYRRHFKLIDSQYKGARNWRIMGISVIALITAGIAVSAMMMYCAIIYNPSDSKGPENKSSLEHRIEENYSSEEGK